MNTSVEQSDPLKVALALLSRYAIDEYGYCRCCGMAKGHTGHCKVGLALKGNSK